MFFFFFSFIHSNVSNWLYQLLEQAVIVTWRKQLTIVAVVSGLQQLPYWWLEEYIYNYVSCGVNLYGNYVRNEVVYDFVAMAVLSCKMFELLFSCVLCN